MNGVIKDERISTLMTAISVLKIKARALNTDARAREQELFNYIYENKKYSSLEDLRRLDKRISYLLVMTSKGNVFDCVPFGVGEIKKDCIYINGYKVLDLRSGAAHTGGRKVKVIGYLDYATCE